MNVAQVFALSMLFHAALLMQSCVGTDIVNDPLPAVAQRGVLLPADVLMQTGQTLKFTATFHDTTGAAVANALVAWHSSDTAIVSVSSDGLATANGVGTATVVATANGIASNSAQVRVVADPTQTRRRTTTLIPGPIAADTARGTVILEENAEGKPTLMFADDFRSQGGPQLEVFLAQSLDPKTGISLGKLQSTSGAQRYDVPAGITLSTYDYVIVYCVPFKVVFGAGMLSKS
ncbi:MAG: DM13 domain-containing protein [Chlorobi bacterium]|nr:MAG: Electron transfer DM13 [Chlorobi bacterium OLB7]MBK8911132.1 DM13 domain-containing protein [Chlorobiota bacterium]